MYKIDDFIWKTFFFFLSMEYLHHVYLQKVLQKVLAYCYSQTGFVHVLLWKQLRKCQVRKEKSLSIIICCRGTTTISGDGRGRVLRCYVRLSLYSFNYIVLDVHKLFAHCLLINRVKHERQESLTWNSQSPHDIAMQLDIPLNPFLYSKTIVLFWTRLKCIKVLRRI